RCLRESNGERGWIPISIRTNSRNVSGRSGQSRRWAVKFLLSILMSLTASRCGGQSNKLFIDSERSMGYFRPRGVAVQSQFRQKKKSATSRLLKLKAL